MVGWNFREYDSFLELLVDVFGLHYGDNYCPITFCKDAITHFTEEIKKNFIDAGLLECFLNNSKLYYIVYGLPIDQQ